MVVHDFDVARPWLPVRPLEAYAPLLIYPDGILAGPVSLEGFKPIAGQNPQGIKGGCSAQDCQPPLGLLLESLERSDILSLAESFCPFVPVAQDHRSASIEALTLYVKRQPQTCIACANRP
jgi:hypothetical protein